MQNSRYWILDTLTRFVILFVIYTNSYLRSHLASVVMRYGAIIHGCGDFHDMATITELVTHLSYITMKTNYVKWNTNTSLLLYLNYRSRKWHHLKYIKSTNSWVTKIIAWRREKSQRRPSATLLLLFFQCYHILRFVHFVSYMINSRNSQQGIKGLIRLKYPAHFTATQNFYSVYLKSPLI